MSQIKRGDPRRLHLHDYILVDPDTRQDVIGFDTQGEAAAWAAQHARGRVLLLDVQHPEGCGCTPGQGVYPSGELRPPPPSPYHVRAFFPSGKQAVLPCYAWRGYVGADPQTGAVFVEVGPAPDGEVFGLDPRCWVTREDTGETLYDPWDTPDLPAFARAWLREHPDWLSPKPKRSMHPLSLEELRRRSG